MKARFVQQGHEVLFLTPDPIGAIAGAARTCYRSEASASPESDELLVRRLIARGHDAMLEHAWLSVRFRTDRAIANELVRHRLLSFAQESTRYVNYGTRGFEFVEQEGLDGPMHLALMAMCEHAAEGYKSLLAATASPEVARAALPLCTATTIVASGNAREWRHVLRLRTASDAHPQMRALMAPLLRELRDAAPALFDDIGTDWGNE